MKMKPADAGRIGQLGKARQRVAARIRAQARPIAATCRSADRAFARPAALARPKAGGLRCVGGLEEGDILAPRLPRGAARPAINPGGPHRIEKAAVLAPRHGRHRGPALLFRSTSNSPLPRCMVPMWRAWTRPLPEACFLIRDRSAANPVLRPARTWQPASSGGCFERVVHRRSQLVQAERFFQQRLGAVSGIRRRRHRRSPVM